MAGSGDVKNLEAKVKALEKMITDRTKHNNEQLVKAKKAFDKHGVEIKKIKVAIKKMAREGKLSAGDIKRLEIDWESVKKDIRTR